MTVEPSDMTSRADFKRMFAEATEVMRRDAQAGRGTASTRVRVRSGATCDVEDGAWKLIGDEMPGDGGAGLGPDPGVFVRAGLGTCLAIGYVQIASVLDVPVEEVEVVVEADYDARGMLGIDPTMPPGWSAVRYAVSIRSPAPEARVRELIELADRRSSVLDIIRRAIPVSSQVHVTGGTS
jgi:uncharacterized OsmC-like protein